MDKAQLIVAIVGVAVTLVGIVIPLVIGVLQLKKHFAWEKAMLASNLGNIWTEKTLVHRKVIEKKYGSYLVNVKPIDPPDCENFVNCAEGHEMHHIKIAVVSLMNYFEDIAVLYVSGMADKAIIDATLRKPIMRYYEKIKPLAGCVDKVAGYPSWKPLDDLIAVWKREDAQREAGIKPKRFP